MSELDDAMQEIIKLKAGVSDKDAVRKEVVIITLGGEEALLYRMFVAGLKKEAPLNEIMSMLLMKGVVYALKEMALNTLKQEKGE